MKRSEEDEYREYVTMRMDRLRRTAYLLCHDWHTADDLVGVTIAKLYRHWSHAKGADHLDAYVRTILLRSWLDERRRGWRREQATADLPDLPADDPTDAVERMTLLELVASLTPRRRAAVVLRFYFDLSVEQTAEELGCSTGTVKSLTSRALEAMRIRAGTPTAFRTGEVT